ncbi:MAG: hypothetical protein DIU79_14765 [Actinobacteria bacterium]|nr:MAG: hypothetical protein DIU79_14765 [Actinomycetota bacterium]
MRAGQFPLLREWLARCLDHATAAPVTEWKIDIATVRAFTRVFDALDAAEDRAEQAEATAAAYRAALERIAHPDAGQDAPPPEAVARRALAMQGLIDAARSWRDAKQACDAAGMDAASEQILRSLEVLDGSSGARA